LENAKNREESLRLGYGWGKCFGQYAKMRIADNQHSYSEEDFNTLQYIMKLLGIKIAKFDDD